MNARTLTEQMHPWLELHPHMDSIPIRSLQFAPDIGYLKYK